MKVLSRLGSLVRYTVAYAAITHCTFEYIGDFVLLHTIASSSQPKPVPCVSFTQHLSLHLCKGPSMEPTLYSDNVLLTERLSKHWRTYQPGDIVIAVSPINAGQFICKRIVAVSGDQVLTQKPIPIEAEYSGSKEGAADKKKPVMIKDYVPRGYVWIEGDNKGNSSDSRYYGPIPVGLIRSRVLCRIWPISEVTGL
ncbi:mitochondrial inner membrane protease subunit 1 isoform X1 [Drosophila rhopaloa]|uniref:Mitochondrial inner membrane protease subunit n=1 Tax=Drosophila rhopaloa TaxID=1041015 RepID=A0A6P4FNK0_DRORH|nr:mitochondrial inner membrane protease subunit 1 isoform X1 [Drosophila rhopaloa]